MSFGQWFEGHNISKKGGKMSNCVVLRAMTKAKNLLLSHSWWNCNLLWTFMSVCWLVGRSVSWLDGRSLMISWKIEMLNFMLLSEHLFFVPQHLFKSTSHCLTHALTSSWECHVIGILYNALVPSYLSFFFFSVCILLVAYNITFIMSKKVVSWERETYTVRLPHRIHNQEQRHQILKNVCQG